LPIDANLPRERLWYLLEHGQVSLVLTQSWYDDQLDWPEGIERLCVDRADQMGLDESPLETVQGPEDLAYVIYTSGSTGLPKGVVIDHRGAVNTVVDINQRFGVEPEDRVLALSALNFDLSVYDIFGMLAAGGTIVMPETSGNRDPAHWAELILREKVTIWDTVPALMQMLVEYLAGRSEKLPESLRLVMMSGDWIPLDLPDRIKTLSDDIEVFSLGGATEASIWSILYRIGEVDPSWTSIPYGRPMVNQSFHVLNETLEPCPVWVPGQLYIGGIGLAKGYWRDEEKTRASFITHPRSGERLYRTGDLGRYLPDGNIEFLGREDFQVKIRGHRIELGEIEAALFQHPGVHTAVVAAAGELRANKRLIAYVVLEQKMTPTIDDLRHFLQQKLADYMVPSAFVLLDALPLSPNGKVDYKALPKPSPSISKPLRSPKAETKGISTQVAKLIASVLEIDYVDPDEDLLNLGINSIEVLRLATLMEQTFGFRPELRRLFQLTTASEIAGNLEQYRRENQLETDGEQEISTYLTEEEKEWDEGLI
jgi:amino acid adenylation domain-containing protein